MAQGVLHSHRLESVRRVSHDLRVRSTADSESPFDQPWPKGEYEQAAHVPAVPIKRYSAHCFREVRESRPKKGYQIGSMWGLKTLVTWTPTQLRESLLTKHFASAARTSTSPLRKLIVKIIFHEKSGCGPGYTLSEIAVPGGM